MTYQLHPGLFVENGAALAAQRVQRRHDWLRLALADQPSPRAANDAAVDEGVIRFAI